MDLLLSYADPYLYEPLLYRQPVVASYLSSLSPEVAQFVRWTISTWWTLVLGGALLYLIFSSLSYLYFFVIYKNHYYPPNVDQPEKGQVKREIVMALQAIPVMATLTVPFFLAELYGYSKLYDRVDEYGVGYMLLSIAVFLVFTDTGIYWIHRWEHTFPWMYKYIHKKHHYWFVPTPYAAIAFHPVDGWLQSTPYHFFVFLMPMHKALYIALFVFIQLWTISIHDGIDYVKYFPWINGSAHHTFHHSKFLYNYGQFFTFWDRVMGSHMDPFSNEGRFVTMDTKKEK